MVAWLVSSRRTSPSFSQCQMLSDTSVWTTCPDSLHDSETAGNGNNDPSITSQTPCNYYTTTSFPYYPKRHRNRKSLFRSCLLMVS